MKFSFRRYMTPSAGSPGRASMAFPLANQKRNTAPMKTSTFLQLVAAAASAVLLTTASYAQAASGDARASWSQTTPTTTSMQESLARLAQGAGQPSESDEGQVVLARSSRGSSSAHASAGSHHAAPAHHAPPMHQQKPQRSKVAHAWNSVKKGASNLTGKRVKGAGKYTRVAGNQSVHTQANLNHFLHPSEPGAGLGPAPTGHRPTPQTNHGGGPFIHPDQYAARPTRIPGPNGGYPAGVRPRPQDPVAVRPLPPIPHASLGAGKPLGWLPPGAAPPNPPPGL
jgi:hypothetical protein